MPRKGMDFNANQALGFGFGRSTRASRNSSGPLVSRFRRWERSSFEAPGSLISSIVSVASSRAPEARAGLLTGGAGVFAFSPRLDDQAAEAGRPIRFTP
jgi:hypothetical protein